MSILNNNNNDNNLIFTPSSETVALQLINHTKNTFQQIVKAYNKGSRMFWANGAGVLPADIASKLGTDAKEIFELHYKLGQLIASVKPEEIEEANSLIGNFMMNEDGTVTIIENEETTNN